MRQTHEFAGVTVKERTVRVWIRRRRGAPNRIVATAAIRRQTGHEPVVGDLVAHEAGRWMEYAWSLKP